MLVGRAITLVAITAAPWAFGCYRFQEQVWLYSALLAAAVVAALVVLIRVIRTPNSSSLRVPLLAIPMFAVIGIGAVQLLPIPQQLTTDRVLQSEELGQWDLGEPITSTHLSFYPHFTTLEVARYTFGTVAFFLGYTLFRTPSSQRLLWAFLMANGLALVVFGLIQRFTWNKKLFWMVDLTNGGDPFASFVNRNNAIAFLYIGGAATIGLLVWAFDRKPVRTTQNVLEGFLARVAAIDAMQVGLLAGIGLLVAGVVASTSRGGALSFAAAGVLSLLFLAFRKRSGWPIFLAGLAVATAVGVVFTLEADRELKQRIAKVDTEKLDERFRIRHAKDALHVTEALPVLGAGLGTHRYAYLPFVSEFGRLWAVNADNQYVEIAVEAGLVGLGVVLVFLLLGCWLIWVGRTSNIESAGTAVALLFLLSSQSIHALFDFGIIMPATLTAAGLLIGSAVASIAARTGGQGSSVWAGRLALPSMMIALCLISVVGVIKCQAAAEVDVALGQTASESNLSDPALDAAIDDLAQLPGAEAARRHARLLVHRYERQAREKLKRISPDYTDQQLDTGASVEGLYVAVLRFRRTGRSQNVAATLQSAEVQENLVPALHSLRRSFSQCPIIPRVFANAGRLASVLEPAGHQGLYHRAALLQPYDDKVVGKAGSDLLEVPADRPIGKSFLRQGLATTRWRVGRDVLTGLQSRYGLDGLVEDICPQNGFGAIRFVQSLQRVKASPGYRDRVLAAGLKAEAGRTGLESMLSRGVILGLLGRPEESLKTFTETVAEHPGSAEAHFQLARALREAGQLDAALFEARVASGLDPNEPGYSRLLNDLTSQAHGGNFETSSVAETQPSRT